MTPPGEILIDNHPKELTFIDLLYQVAINLQDEIVFRRTGEGCLFSQCSLGSLRGFSWHGRGPPVGAFLDRQGVLSPWQYGFRAGHSPAMAILDMAEKVRG